MTEAPGPKKGVIIEKLVTSNTFKIEALIEVLAKKGIVNKKEIFGSDFEDEEEMKSSGLLFRNVVG